MTRKEKWKKSENPTLLPFHDIVWIKQITAQGNTVLLMFPKKYGKVGGMLRHASGTFVNRSFCIIKRV
jgi:hypothetical protein